MYRHIRNLLTRLVNQFLSGILQVLRGYCDGQPVDCPGS